MRKKLLNIKGEILKSLRESSGYSVEEVSKKLKISPIEMQEIEKGNLTLSLLKKLANIYKVSLTAFFSDSIPQIPVIPDYRLNREKKLTPSVFLAQRRAHLLAKELFYLTERKSDIPSIEGTSENLAKEFRKWLKIKIIKNEPSKKILSEYKTIIEEKMFVPVIEQPLKADDIRAFSIFSDIAIVVLNEDDAPEVKLFSLFHELAHILKRNGGICSIDFELENEEVEKYCDQFAAEFLVPEDDFRVELKARNLKFPFKDEEIRELSKIYGVSKQVIMLRLLLLGFINKERYREYKERYKKLEKRKKYGRRNWEEVFFNRAGGLILREISKSYRSGRITLADVITALEMHTKYAEKFI